MKQNKQLEYGIETFEHTWTPPNHPFKWRARYKTSETTGFSAYGKTQDEAVINLVRLIAKMRGGEVCQSN